jgi:CxxC-x17-CxxC domain-containing protein
MSYEDKTIVCVECGQEFVHSADDQARYAERGFTNEPKRCRDCRESRKTRGSGRGAGRRTESRPPREMHEVVCAECGALTTVPFKPTEGRPVYCRDCFRSKRDAST